MREKKDSLLRRNAGLVEVTNLNYYSGEFDFSAVWCPVLPRDVDYIALYDRPSEYEKGKCTAIAFFLDDVVWNGKDGIFPAIYYGDKERQSFFKNRFRRNDGKPPIFIEPDVSVIGGMDRSSIIWAYKQMSSISTFLVNECGGIVIPLLTFATEREFPLMVEGKENTEMVAFSLFGYMKDPTESDLLVKAVKYACDNLKHLKTIVIYSGCPDDSKNLSYFRYAREKGIKILIPGNHWRNIRSK